MNVQEQIKTYIAGQPEPKRSDLQTLHDSILQISPGCKLWFLDGKDDKGKVVSNPNIGFGNYTMRLAAGKTREFYQVGLTANATGTSVYIMGIEDKKYLSETYAAGLNAMSTPILATNNATGNGAVGVLAMSGPSVRLTEAKMQQWAPELKRAAADIARASAASPLFRRAYGR